MKFTKALRIAKILYCLCFALTAIGLLVGLIDFNISKILYAAALAAVLGYAIVSALYLHCPKCGSLIRVNPLVKQTKCPHCREPFDGER